jgi:TusE/DsrC/DsvC family sulfur relay protein
MEKYNLGLHGNPQGGAAMGTVRFGNKTYHVETEYEFISDSGEWDENFARGMAPKCGIVSGLSGDHWKVIYFIRDFQKKTGKCPLVYETCRMNHLHLLEMKKLFPSGYLRGACKLAGVTYKQGCLEESWVEEYIEQSWMKELAERATTPARGKTYEIDVRGFLVDPYQWDREFAAHRASEVNIPKLTDRHWRVISFLRDKFEKDNVVPTVYETCEALGMEFEELEALFPTGYHRGAVKVAGLRVL